MRILALLVVFFSSANASDDCADLTKALDAKMKAYRAYRDENQARRDLLNAKEAQCKEEGIVLSAQAAKLAEALSCQSEQDVSSLDSRISKLGKKCEDVFHMERLLQGALQEKFQDTQVELKDGISVIDESELIQLRCSENVKVSRAMASAFLLLEGNLAAVKGQASEGEAEYLQLKEAGEALMKRTADLSKNCDLLPGVSGSGPSLVKSAPAAGAGATKAAKNNRSSDITGTEKALSEEKKAKSLVK